MSFDSFSMYSVDFFDHSFFVFSFNSSADSSLSSSFNSSFNSSDFSFDSFFFVLNTSLLYGKVPL